MPTQFALISIAKHTNILCETHDHEAKSFLVFLKFKLSIWWQARHFSRINLLQLPETKQWSITWLIEILCSLVVSFRNVSLVLKQNVLTTCLHFQLCHQSSNIWRSFILRKLLNQLPFFSLFYKWVLRISCWPGLICWVIWHAFKDWNWAPYGLWWLHLMSLFFSDPRFGWPCTIWCICGRVSMSFHGWVMWF